MPQNKEATAARGREIGVRTLRQGAARGGVTASPGSVGDG